MKNKTLSQLQKRRQADKFNTIIFSFLLGAVFTALIYFLAIHFGYIQLIILK